MANASIPLKTKVFLAFLCAIILSMIYYASDIGFGTTNGIRFIMGAIFVGVLCYFLIKNKVNTKSMGYVFLIYLLLDSSVSFFLSRVVVADLVVTLLLVLVVVYYLFFKKR
jgi:hypothetical protein